MHEDFTIRATAIRDHLGKIIGTSVHKFQVDDPLEEEVYAALLGVEEAKRRGFPVVTVEGDSLLAIKALSKYQAQVNQLLERWDRSKGMKKYVAMEKWNTQLKSLYQTINNRVC